MFSLSRFADYSVRILSVFITNKNKTMLSGSEISKLAKIPLPTVAKILKILNSGGLLKSTRGINGGYELAKNPKDISVFDVLILIDGPLALTDCVSTSNKDCDAKATCSMYGGWEKLNNKIVDAFKTVSIKEICMPINFID